MSTNGRETLRMAYADPPYVGQAKRHYADHADYAGEVDHTELIARLERDYPDGWALSASSPSLRYLLPLCPEDVRVMVWIKPFGAYKRNVRVAYVWEPVILRPARRLFGAVVSRDFFIEEDMASEVFAESIMMRKGFSGSKPERLCFWLFNVMGLRSCDQLDDLFPGTGAVGEAWAKWVDLGGPKIRQALKTTNDLVYGVPSQRVLA
jgi:hypothetical protein